MAKTTSPAEVLASFERNIAAKKHLIETWQKRAADPKSVLCPAQYEAFIAQAEEEIRGLEREMGEARRGVR